MSHIYCILIIVLIFINGALADSNDTCLNLNLTDCGIIIKGSASIGWKNISTTCSSTVHSGSTVHTSSKPFSPNRTPVGLIAGISAGAIVLLVAGGIFSWKLKKRKSGEKPDKEDNVEMEPHPQTSLPQISDKEQNDPELKETNESNLPNTSDPKLIPIALSVPPTTNINSVKQNRRIFISYCWKNSKQHDPLSIGQVDPRDITKRIEQMINEKCWIDVDTTNGGHAVFSAIQMGINQAEVMIACVSDEYIKSDTCEDELTFARKTLKKHIIPIIVGEGMEWQNSWAGLMLAKELYIDFRDPSKFNSNMDKLIGRLQRIFSGL